MRLQVPGSEQIVDIGTRKQLFIDDHIIETTRWIAPRAAGAARWVQPPDQRNDLDGWREEDDRLDGDVPGQLIRATAFTTRTLNQPTRHCAEPLMVREQESEGNTAPHPATVLYDEEEGLWKMWYCSLTVQDFPERAFWYKTHYATSADGLSWHRPELDVVPGTNLVNETKCQYVVKDPTAPPARRYKMGHGGRQPALYHSPDGIHWTIDPGSISSGRGDETLCLMYDPTSEKYLGFCRNPYPRPMLVHRTERSILRMQSNNLVDWSQSVPIIDKDPLDPFDRDFYGMEAMYYEGMYLGFLRVHHTASDHLDAWLTYSRDSFNWERVRSGPFLGCSPEPGWEWGMVSMFQAPVPVSDELWVYYTGSDGLHDAHDKLTGLGLAKLRHDGFASIDSWPNDHKNKAAGKNYPPTLLTKALHSPGNRLIVNAKTGRFIASELLDLDGRILPGFSRADCDPFYGDSLAHPFTWRGNPDIGGLAPVRIRFYLEDAKLYALQIPKEQPQ